MELIDFATTSDNLLFSAALLILLFLIAIEGIGWLLGMAASGALDGLLGLQAGDADGGAPTVPMLGSLLSWLYVGTVPVLILLACFLLAFGGIGLALQAGLHATTGALLPWYLAAPAAVLLALPCVRAMGAVMARILPHDETQAVSQSSLIGRDATLVLGSASQGAPAQAKVRDQYGHSHYVMLEPDDPMLRFEAGDTVVLVSRHGAIYHAIPTPTLPVYDRGER